MHPAIWEISATVFEDEPHLLGLYEAWRARSPIGAPRDLQLYRRAKAERRQITISAKIKTAQASLFCIRKSPVPTLYLCSSSNFSSKRWIFFLSAWILLVSWAVVSSSFSSSQEPRDELRLRLQGESRWVLDLPRLMGRIRCKKKKNAARRPYLTKECALGGEGGTSVSDRYCWHWP